MYYFAQDCSNDVAGHLIPWFKRPIYRILDNGTSIDLELEIPFAEEYWAAKGKIEDLSWSYVQAPFYQRFYEYIRVPN
jgi:hypothetical protein